jgi:RNA polymerase sigma-70 factor (ECF subfamily)
MTATDPSLFVQLLLQHQNDVLRYILPLVGCLDDAHDVLQETATALWRKFEQYDPEQPFLPWAKRFARNEVLMHHRKRSRYVFLTEELVETLAERQSEYEKQALERRQALRTCIEKLPEADRLLLDQRYAEPGTTIQQLAAETGATVNVLYKALARVRRQLLDCVTRTLALADAV